jgi:biotin carboxyl carrier protein
MDVKIKKKASSFTMKKKIIIGIAFAVALLVNKFIIQEDGESLSRDSLIISKINKGDLEISVDGYGQLRSKKQRLITSITAATVNEIILKPGALVEPDSVIAVLSNPELELEVRSVKNQLARLKTDLQQNQLEQERELLREIVELDRVMAEHESQNKLLAAQSGLHIKGIVSSLAFEDTNRTVERLVKEIHSKNKQISQLKRIFAITNKVNEQEILHQKEFVDLTLQRHSSMQVKAGFSGILQRLHIEIGQTLVMGQEIALVGSKKELIALIRVPQSMAQQVQLGMTAEIDTRLDKIEGKVERIDPIVEDNMVEVEISLLGPMPNSARPELNVDGKITVGRLKDVLYVRRPANVISGQIKTVYKLVPDLGKTSLVEIEFGLTSGEFIEVIRGLEVDNSIIISDLSSYIENRTILNVY